MSPRRKDGSDGRDAVERATFILVGAVLGIVPLLLFFFSFGNVGLLGTSLGVEHSIAFLTGPAVDLAVAGCVVASSYLSTRGWTERRLWPLHLAATLLGATMVALNTGGALYTHRWRLAAFDSVGPMMLVGWGLLAPWLWRNMTEARRGSTVQAPTVHRPSAKTVQPKADRPPVAPSTPAPTVQPADRPAAAPTGQERPQPSTVQAAADGAPTGQPSMDVWVEIGRPVYDAVKRAHGKRPPEGPFQEALAAAAARLVAAGDLPEAYANPALSTAKRVRKAIEDSDPALTPVHLVPAAAKEAS